MAYEFDSDFQAAVQETLKELGVPPDAPPRRFAKGDIPGRREGASFAKLVFALEPEIKGVQKTRYTAPAPDGYEVPIFAYRSETAPTSTGLQPAVLYLHGGGMIIGSAEMFEPITKADVVATGVTHFSVDYRLAPESRHPTPVEDCYAALVWLHSHAKDLGIDNSRICIVGLSAGGGLAAGVALMARDRGLSPPLAKQILECPMLDDRNAVTDEALAPLLSWTYIDNWTGWNALLGDKLGSSDVSEYAAPARATNLKGLPPTYIDVGSIDAFAKEDELFASRLKEAGVEVEWHLYKGVPHGFEFRGRKSKLAREAQSNRRAAILSC